MRRIPLLIGLALVISSLAVAAQEPSGVPYITVSGFAEDWVDPDVAVWAIRITNDGKDLRELKQANDAEYERVLNVAYALEVRREHVIAGRVFRSTPERIHLQQRVYLRFALVSGEEDIEGP